MVRVGFRACSFSPGWARATGNLHGLISGRNISNSGCIRAAFGPHLGRILAAFGPHSGHIWATFSLHLGHKKFNYWNSKYNLLKVYSKVVNNLGQENIISGPSKMWPRSGRATQKPLATGQILGWVLAWPSPTTYYISYSDMQLWNEIWHNAFENVKVLNFYICT